MRKAVRLLAAVTVVACFFVAEASTETLPLPANLISLNSEEGERLLLQSNARQSYWNLSLQFLTQKTQSFCGVASIVMVLNALGTPAPTTPAYEPYRVFTQDDFFNDRTEKVLRQSVLAEKGMTLDQIGQLLGSYGVHAEVHHAGEAKLDDFRKSAMEHVAKPGEYVLVNYLRRSIGQERGGHISPLAAYDAATDRFLILDVARYKYPPVWVKAGELFDAMNTTDSDNENRTRGYVLIDLNP
jgi:Phytochelatin synthase